MTPPNGATPLSEREEIEIVFDDDYIRQQARIRSISITEYLNNIAIELLDNDPPPPPILTRQSAISSFEGELSTNVLQQLNIASRLLQITIDEYLNRFPSERRDALIPLNEISNLNMFEPIPLPPRNLFNHVNDDNDDENLPSI